MLSLELDPSSHPQVHILPEKTGLFEVLANHAPMVAALGQGTGRIINTDGKKMAFTIEGGFVEVLKNEVSLLVRGYQAK